MWDARVTGRFFCFGTAVERYPWAAFLYLNRKYTGTCRTRPVIINFPTEVKNVFANPGSISYDRKRMLIGRYL